MTTERQCGRLHIGRPAWLRSAAVERPHTCKLQVTSGGTRLKSYKNARFDGLMRLGDGTLGLIALILVSAASTLAQSIPASVSTIPQPSLGHPAFDALGNTYYLSG